MSGLGKAEVPGDMRAGANPASQHAENGLTPPAGVTAKPLDAQASMRREFVNQWKRHERRRAAAEATGLLPHDRGWPRFDFGPFADLRCGATGKRTGLPCPLTSVYGNGRCRFHGGLSTGPTTAAGKRKAAMNGNAPKRTA